MGRFDLLEQHVGITQIVLLRRFGITQILALRRSWRLYRGGPPTLSERSSVLESYVIPFVQIYLLKNEKYNTNNIIIILIIITRRIITVIIIRRIITVIIITDINILSLYLYTKIIEPPTGGTAPGPRHVRLLLPGNC